MNKSREGRMPVALSRVQTKFKSWREQKQGRERIPEALWQAAVRVARKHGVNQVSSVLGLDYSHLKRRTSQKAKVSPASEPVFVEMQGVQDQRDPTCIVELEKENGTRMRICVRDSATVDWARMKEAFLGA